MGELEPDAPGDGRHLLMIVDARVERIGGKGIYRHIREGIMSRSDEAFSRGN